MRPQIRGAETLLLAALLIACCPNACAQTAPPPAQAPKPIQITAVTPNTTTAPLYGRIELQVDLQATYDNPFDPAQISVDAQVTPPSGKSYTVPAFYSQSFTRDLTGKGEVLKPAGQPSWQVRLALLEKGVSKVVVTAKDNTGLATSKEVDLTASEAKTHGFIGVSPRDFHYFEHVDGSPFFPIGATLLPRQGLIDLETWLPALSASGANTARLILGPEDAPFALVTKASGAYKLDLGNAWRLDQAVDLMDKDGIHPILCIDTFNELRDRDFDPRWTKNPYNHDNGGPLNTDKEFWTSDAMDKLYNAKLRYLVARYGAYSNILGWEMWEDTDQIHNYDPDIARQWIQRHAEILKSLDPFRHLVTTSFAEPLGDRDIDHLPEIDFVESHIFDFADLVPELTLQISKKIGYGKPHLVTEVAASRSSDHASQDANGLQVHDPLWSSVAFGAAGAAMPWWWDSYVFPKRIYNRFNAIAAFVKGIDFPSQHFRSTTASFSFQSPLESPMYRDLMIERGPVSFGDTEYNLPRRVRIRPGGVQYGLPVSGVLQGGKLHPSKFNPVTFVIDLRRQTQFDLILGDVSGVGGANIQVKLDGEVVMGLDLPDTDGLDNTDTITRYRGTHSLTIPAGHHEITVANLGNDWAMASYRFRDVLERKTPPLVGFGLVGDNLALAWVRHSDRSWDRIEVQKRPVQTSPATFMTLQGLVPGSWRVELWDTWAGKTIRTSRITVGSDGVATVNLPELDSDVAVKLVKPAAARKKTPSR